MDDERFKRIVTDSVTAAMRERGPYCNDHMQIVKSQARMEGKVDALCADMGTVKKSVQKLSDNFIAHASVVNKQVEYLDQAKKLANEDSIEIKGKMLEAEKKLSKMQPKDSYPPNGRRFKQWHVYTVIAALGTGVGAAILEFVRQLIIHLGQTPPP